MAKPLPLSQAFQGMILEKQAAGLSAHTISDYRNTLAKAHCSFRTIRRLRDRPRALW